MAAQPWLWIIGGPNGAGKTTFCMVILPQMVKTFEYVNADLIAAGLSPLDPARAPLRAGRLMMERVEELMKDGKTFAVESTLAGRTFLDLAQRAKIDGWKGCTATLT
jgi:predicted ABC-type ATPase